MVGYRTNRIIFGVIIILSLICGCSGGNSPISSSTPDNSTQYLQLSEKNPTGEQSAHSLLGYWTVTYDPEKGEAEIVPVRSAERHWNVLWHLEKNPCKNCLKVKIKGPGPTGLLVDVTVVNPFPLANITAFDVRGIMMFDGSRVFPASGLNMSDMSLGDGEIINPDGYTTLYNPSTKGSGPGGFEGYLPGKMSTPVYPSAKLNGYKRFISDKAGNYRNAFYAGDSVTVTYEAKFPPAPIIFGYAIDANWVKPDKTPVTDPMTDFPLSANCPEPWKIEVSEELIGDGLTSAGGQTKLLADIYDYQGSDSHFLPFIECPELFDGTQDMEWKSDGDGFSHYEIVVENENLSPGGEFMCMVGCRDHEDETSSDWMDLTSYQIRRLLVTLKCVAKAKAEPNPQTVCEEIHFTDDGSYDPDGGEIVTYEWDWDNDGVYDEEGADVYHSWETTDTQYIQFRVTDDQMETGELAEPLTINIENALPTAVAEANQATAFTDEPIDFDASESHDNDCGGESIVLYEWDWENDGEFDGLPQVKPFDSHAYDSPGVYEVMLRVTDDEDGQGLLDEPLQITVYSGEPIAFATADPNPQTVCLPVQFSDNGSYDPDGGAISVYEWDFNNDGIYDSVGEQTAYYWLEPGEYDVQFRVTDDEGMTGELEELLHIVIENALPTAEAFAGQYTTIVGEPVDFNGILSHDNDCGGQKIVLWGWDWENDGIFDEPMFEPITQHTFDEAGLYEVMLKVTDDEGGFDDLDEPLQIMVFEGGPIAYAAAEPNPQIVCEQVHFFDDGSYSQGGGLIVKYEWDWDNDGVFDEEGEDAYHAWLIPGTYFVNFKVTDDLGFTGELDKPLEVVIENALPTAIGQADKYTVNAGEPIIFDGSLSHDNDCGNQFLMNFEWDWESDGIYDDVGMLCVHIYSDPGVYTFTLRVTDNEGETSESQGPEQIVVN